MDTLEEMDLLGNKLFKYNKRIGGKNKMNENKKTLKFKENELFFQVTQYKNDGNLAILAYTEEEPYGDITTNLSGYFVD